MYAGDEKGNVHIYYPIRVKDSDVISKSGDENTRSISKNKIDKILCYKEVSMVLILTGETLIACDSSLKRS